MDHKIIANVNTLVLKNAVDWGKMDLFALIDVRL